MMIYRTPHGSPKIVSGDNPEQELDLEMLQRNIEILVGALVLAIAIGFAGYFYSATQHTSGSNYMLKGRFSHVDGLKIGADVNLVGIKIGRVMDMEIDRETLEAIVTFSVDSTIMLPRDSNARIRPEGLLGGYYIALEPGGETVVLTAGEEIIYTEGSVSLLDLAGSYLLSTESSPATP